MPDRDLGFEFLERGIEIGSPLLYFLLEVFGMKSHPHCELRALEHARDLVRERFVDRPDLGSDLEEYETELALFEVEGQNDPGESLFRFLDLARNDRVRG